VLGLRALRLRRSIRSFTGALSAGLTTLGERAAATEAHAVAVGERTERLTAAVEHLQESLVRLKIITAAVDDARRTLTGWSGVMPKK
jgi:UDP-N-acetylmuramoylalanine-D-glutamate ligase